MAISFSSVQHSSKVRWVQAGRRSGMSLPHHHTGPDIYPVPDYLGVTIPSGHMGKGQSQCGMLHPFIFPLVLVCVLFLFPPLPLSLSWSTLMIYHNCFFPTLAHFFLWNQSIILRPLKIRINTGCGWAGLHAIDANKGTPRTWFRMFSLSGD